MNRREPVRSCAACRTRCPQGALVRVARQPSGNVVIEREVRTGRGAYLCMNESCVTLAERRQVLRRALKSFVPDTIYEELRRMLHEHAACKSHDG